MLLLFHRQSKSWILKKFAKNLKSKFRKYVPQFSRRLTLFGHIMRMDDNADAKRILLDPLQWTGEDNQVVPASRGSAPSNRIWNNTTLRSLKQQIWLRTALCGGWCRRMALRNLRVACQKRRRRQFCVYWHITSHRPSFVRIIWKL